MINPQKNNEPLDLSYLKDMSGDSAEFIIEMIDLFKTQTPAYVAELKRAMENQDWPNVAANAHKIKPTLSYVGRDDAKDFMQTIEHNARDLKNLETMPGALEEVIRFAEVLYRQLDESKAELAKRL